MTGKNFYTGLFPENIKGVASWKIESTDIIGGDIKIKLLPPSAVI